MSVGVRIGVFSVAAVHGPGVGVEWCTSSRALGIARWCLLSWGLNRCACCVWVGSRYGTGCTHACGGTLLVLAVVDVSACCRGVVAILGVVQVNQFRFCCLD